MKRCPTCARACPDDLTFCVDDGATLEATDLRTLADLAVARPPFPVARALRIAKSLCEAYAPERTRGRVPPPLLPLDVEVTDDDRALVTFSHDAKPAAASERDLDPAAPYAAPETFPGGGAVTEAASVYHVAALVHHLLTGAAPFDGSTTAAVAVRKLLEAAPSARDARPELPAALDEALVRALDRDPSRRFATPAAFAEALAAVVVAAPSAPVLPAPSAAPAMAAPPSAFGAMAPAAAPPSVASPRPTTSRGLFALGGGLALLGVIAALSLTLTRTRRNEAPAASAPAPQAREAARANERPTPPSAPPQPVTVAAQPATAEPVPPTPAPAPAPFRRRTVERARRPAAPHFASRGARMPSAAPATMGQGAPAAPDDGLAGVHAPPAAPGWDPLGDTNAPRRSPRPRHRARVQGGPPPSPAPQPPSPTPQPVAPSPPVGEGAPAARTGAPVVAPQMEVAPIPSRSPPPVSAPSADESPPLLPIVLALGAAFVGLVLLGVGLLLRRRAAPPPPYAPPAYAPPAYAPPAPQARPANIPATLVVPADAPATLPDAPVWQGSSPDALAQTLVAAPSQSAVWCLRCGTPSPADARFCPNDGVDLRAHGSTVDPHAARGAQATQPDMKPFAVGQYRCESRLGEGGMGVVYRARHADTGAECAVKVLLVRGRAEGPMAERFRKEARLASSVRHPNCVAIYDYGEVAGQLFYLAMELVDGRSLDEALGGRAMPAARVEAIVLQVCAALDAAHAAGVVHRDLKPQNVMVRAEARGDVVKLVDFGIARDLNAGGTTLAGVVVGTPAYMAPEQARAEAGVDGRADVFSVGVMTWELLTGKLPYEPAGTAIQQVVARATLRESVPPTGVSRAVDDALARATEPDAARRTPDVRTFAAELGRALQAAAA